MAEITLRNKEEINKLRTTVNVLEDKVKELQEQTRVVLPVKDIEFTAEETPTKTYTPPAVRDKWGMNVVQQYCKWVPEIQGEER